MGERKRVKYPFDARVFHYGEIYKVKDIYIVFSEEKYVNRAKHESRLVCVIHHCEANSDPRAWVINVAPLSSRVEMKRDNDLEITPQEGNYINRCSLIRLGCAQPLLKIDLEGPVGVLTESQLHQLTALQIILTGTELD
ncbi:Fe-S-cluster-containing hydrogenase components 1 [Paenibacillus popilliae ATCC 14706]|uniref:Fe-S-cluster-containing hydrogenase components 1 n=1 Tax=Paenibacillus popilliae ATCC 14706 TaxID=1212764 RepID=M9M8L9_PAEPP|nr:Fe-S-cluster-containing hydrogenase components 1 [Paenibacillus popilliae ATCC 14706]